MNYFDNIQTVFTRHRVTLPNVKIRDKTGEYKFLKLRFF